MSYFLHYHFEFEFFKVPWIIKLLALASYGRANCPEETPYAYDFYGTPMCCEEDVDYYCDANYSKCPSDTCTDWKPGKKNYKKGCLKKLYLNHQYLLKFFLCVFDKFFSYFLTF